MVVCDLQVLCFIEVRLALFEVLRNEDDAFFIGIGIMGLSRYGYICRAHPHQIDCRIWAAES